MPQDEIWFSLSQAGVSKLLGIKRKTLITKFVCKLMRLKNIKASTDLILMESMFLRRILSNHKSKDWCCFKKSNIQWIIFPMYSRSMKYFWMILFVSHFFWRDNQDLSFVRSLQYKPLILLVTVSVQSDGVTQILKKE